MVLDGLQVLTHTGEGVNGLHFLLNKPNRVLLLHLCSNVP